MIGKKIENPKKASSKALRIARLTRYIESPEDTNADEKCVYSRCRGFLTDSQDGRIVEMIALAEEAPRSRDPINHYVLSWQTEERPTAEQVDKAVDILLDQFGVGDHQVVYGLHANTDNYHLHVEINRVHPDTLKCVEINKGFDIEALHMAVARIENTQGWSREVNARYVVNSQGELVRDHAGDERPRQPSQPRRDVEYRTGEKSAERIAIEEGGPIIEAVGSWRELHDALAAKGLRYEKAGSGAVVFVGEIAVKASRMDRRASLRRLEKRFGPYESRQKQMPIVGRDAQPLSYPTPAWVEYRDARVAHVVERDTRKQELDRKYDQERGALADKHKTQREAVLGRRWKRKGDLLNALRSVLAAEQAAERAALKERYQRERSAWQEQYRPFPSFEEWLRERDNALSESWRNRASMSRIEGDGEDVALPPLDIAGFEGKVVGGRVDYLRKAGNNEVAFVDRGRRIDVHDWRSPDALLAALQLGARKWGAITVTGSDDYKARCIALAAEYGLRIINPELQSQLAELQDATAQRKRKIEHIQHRNAPSSVKEKGPTRSSRGQRGGEQDIEP